MPLIVTKLEKDLESIIKDSASSALNTTFDVDSTKGLSATEIKSRVSKEFGNEFAKQAAPKLAAAIDTYIKSMTLVPVLTAPTGPVVGTITVT